MSVGVSMCSFRKQLPKGHGKMTIGSGCVVHRKFNSDGSNSKEDVFLVTTTQVVTKQELLAKNTGITAEFLNKRESFSLDSAEVFDIPDPVHGGILAGMESSEAKRMQQESAQVSFIFIPVHKFDSRNVFVKKFIPFITFSLEKKRAMSSRSQSDEILQSSIASRKVLCHVLSDSGRGDGYYNTEPYCLEFRDETNDFTLTSVTDRDGAAVESQKDLHREEKPWGAILMNEEGEFVGMLAVGTSQQKKLYPLFLPTLAQDNQSSCGVRETPSLPPEKDRPPRNRSSNGQSRHGDTDLPSLPRSQSDVFGPETPNQSPRTTRHNTIPRKQLEHILPGSFLKDEIVSRQDAMDVLILHLDRSVCLAPGIPDTQRWERLADQLKVPDDVKSQCANFSGKLSSSESLFEHLCATQDFLTVKQVKSCLKNLGRNDVVAELEKNIHLKDESTVTDLYEKHSELLCNICMKLDDKRSIRNWSHFGIALGIKSRTLKRLRDPSGDSPSELVLKMIQTRKPRLPLEKLVAVINLPGVTKALASFPGNSTIETLLGDMDAMENVTTLLDPDRKWQRVGQHYNIDQRILDNLKPGDFQSPTKTMLEYIVKREPTATVDTFLRSLLNINRSDVIEDLKEIFYADDIERILRAGGPVPL